MNGQDETSAGRLAAILLMVGLVILVVSLGVLSFGEHEAIRGDGAQPPAAVSRDEAQLTWLRAMFWLALLIFFFVLALTAFLRWSHHYRRRLLRPPSSPTEYSDAWSQYRLPPDYDAADEFDDDEADDEATDAEDDEDQV